MLVLTLWLCDLTCTVVLLCRCRLISLQNKTALKRLWQRCIKWV
nr:MAG TPA: hypothetical protein [Caudoviricetes sp.]DAW51923.1 MAG TPA: hypothetical protein [Bacteriophage sp.]